MAPKVIILTGAPESSSLDWSPQGLLDSFLEPVARFAGLYKSPPPGSSQIESSPVLDTAVWRSIPLVKTRLATGFSQVHQFEAEYMGDSNFFAATAASSQDTHTSSQDQRNSTIHDEFYDHSLAIHDDIPSSQLPSQSTSTDDSSIDTTGNWSYDDSEITASLSVGDRTMGLGSAHLSDLEDLPNAFYLRSISPQTMTVNIIAGIISIAEPRTIKTRWGTTKSLVELIVGDDTKSGFSITFWLSVEAFTAGPAKSPEHTIRELRRQDVVLLRNVALSEYKNKVHGHSLRKGLTKIDLIYRRKLSEDDTGGFYTAKDLASTKGSHPQLLKARKVREWVSNFVGGGPVLGKRKHEGKPMRSWDMPPPDTQ
ncbi:uncharacterized protein BCR38DRAFT_439775 [Pseudomassariella vexata]|uniref:Nucleic acid-binding protein n=1 Tax=Pseudomassariella vexata TaxID=1141098 RepID=A0A1Y2DRI2_9PEZI|nr:uncharacterized protein BCR38DRAFT_439775 [Pseudomassariella vexata]ORY61285.1 hypothetical protein BCR38DRAFT_439775 [Pseudomassariella vexata]